MGSEETNRPFGLAGRDQKQSPRERTLFSLTFLSSCSNQIKVYVSPVLTTPEASHDPRNNINVLYWRDFRSRPWDVPLTVTSLQAAVASPRLVQSQRLLTCCPLRLEPPCSHAQACSCHCLVESSSPFSRPREADPGLSGWVGPPLTPQNPQPPAMITAVIIV